MKNKLILIIALTYATISLNSQTIPGGSQEFDFMMESLRINENLEKHPQAKGSPYIQDSYQIIKIKGYDKNFKGRYNAYNGQMEIDTGSELISLDKNKDFEINFVVNNVTYKSYNYTNNLNDVSRDFLRIIFVKKDFSLLKKEIIKYYEKVPAKSAYHKQKPAIFKRESDHFYIEKNNTVSYLPNRKNDLLKLYPTSSKEIKAFLKKEKISLKKEEDLIKLADFLSTL